MSTPQALHLQTWNATKHAKVDVPLDFVERVAAAELRCLPGASGIHVVLASDAGVQLRAEVVAEAGEIVALRVEVDERGAPHLSSHGRHVMLLPGDSRYEPAAPICPSGADAPVDVAIVVDGTTRSWTATGANRLLDRKEPWAAHVEKLVAFVSHVAGGRDARVAVLAFGDQLPPSVTAPDLQPLYQLHPAEGERVLQAFDRAVVTERLLALPSTPGADFVDATADALEACVQLRWREAARKIVVLTGDSPGASVLHPLPKGADLAPRRLDVDTRAARLHRHGVEIVTIYHPPDSTLALENVARQRELLRSARDQYERLASRRELAFVESSFDPDAAAERLLESGIVARGAALGEITG